MSRVITTYLMVMIVLGAASCGGGGGGNGGTAGTSAAVTTSPFATSPAPAPVSVPDPVPVSNTVPPVTLQANQGQALLGPIVNATVSVYKAADLNSLPVCTAQTTSVTDSRGPGVMDLSTCPVLAGVLYFVVIRGGSDVDVNDDGILDSVPTRKNGSLRALITGQAIKAGGFRVNLFTEIAYQSVSDLLLSGRTSPEVLSRLDSVANLLLSSDLNRDGVINYADILFFNPASHSDSIPDAVATQAEKILKAILGGNIGELTALSRTFLLSSLGEHEYVYFPAPGQTYQNLLIADFIVENGLLYAAGFEAGSAENDLKVLILDVRDFSKPKRVGELNLVGLPVNPQNSGLKMIKKGNYLYLVSAGVGMIVANVTTPAAPTATVQFPGEKFAAITATDNNIIYVSSYNFAVDPIQKSVSAYDISNPATPSIRSTINHLAFSMVYNNGHLYTYGSGISTLTASPSGNLSLLDNLSFPSGSGDDLVYRDGFVYVPRHEPDIQGMSIFDVTNPDDIKLKESLSGFGFISRLAIDGNLLFAGSSLDIDSAIVTTFDISTPGTPEIRDTRSAPGNSYMDIDGGNIYLSGPTMFGAYEIAALKNKPQYFGFYATPRVASHVEVVGSVAFVADGTDLIAIDVSSPGDGMELLDTISVTDHILDLTIVGDYAYLANTMHGLKIINISNPANLVMTGFNDVLIPIIDPLIGPGANRSADAVTVLGNSAYVSAGSYPYGKLGRFMITNPAAPVLATETANVASQVKDIAGKGNSLYTVGSNTLNTYNAETLALTRQQILDANSIEIQGNYAYTSSATSGLGILDISTPSTPIKLGSELGIGIGNAVSVVDNVAYVANEFGYVEAYDITDKNNPDFLSVIQISGAVRDVFATKEYLYTVNGFGLVVQPAIQVRDQTK